MAEDQTEGGLHPDDAIEGAELDQQQPSGRGMFLNAGVLYGIACEALRRTASAPSDRAPEQFDALVAMLFAAASLEAFINELAYMARATSLDPESDQTVRNFGELEGEAEDGRASLEMAQAVLSLIPKSADPRLLDAVRTFREAFAPVGVGHAEASS